MKGKTAALSFLGFCVMLAILLLTHTISPMMSGCIFATGLVLAGGVSRGFQKL